MTEDYHRCVEFLQAKAPHLKVFEHEPGEVIVNCYVLQDYIIKLLKIQEIAKECELRECSHPNATSVWSATQASTEHFTCPDCHKKWSD